jgi:hypothetical protein
MKTASLLHHSFMAAERSRRHKEIVRAWLMAALVVAMFGAGVVVGILCK